MNLSGSSQRAKISGIFRYKHVVKFNASRQDLVVRCTQAAEVPRMHVPWELRAWPILGDRHSSRNRRTFQPQPAIRLHYAKACRKGVLEEGGLWRKARRP